MTMQFAGLKTLRDVARTSRGVLQRAFFTLVLRVRRPVVGRFQPHNHTVPDRYPWLFQFASSHLAGREGLRILSFGCSRGDEVFGLRSYFPTAALKGIDIDPRNVSCCVERAQVEKATGMTFDVAGTTEHEQSESYDAIFCLAVLCLSDLTILRAPRCDPFLRFEDFERTVGDFARCLKPGGLLLLHTTNFRFCDTSVAGEFDVVLEADPAQLAPAVKYDRHNRLMQGERYRAVAFRKCDSTPSGGSSRLVCG